ncbi:aminoglycoside 3'-phosphotransferase [Pseudomonas sp. CCC3.1]|nr:APH(3') family aminoglycoside O-phosphotransferase [Pseudomonas sp. CCC3.1]MEB0205890.1 aminoglycoside 3'-phosphotransferase [Pseudomonas sp. CCC3.1]
MSFKLPMAIQYFIGDAVLNADDIGESPCDVYSFQRGNDRFFLKFCPVILAPTTYSVLREARVLSWLMGRLNVPEVVMVDHNLEGEYMLTRCVPGVPLQARIDDPASITGLFRESLRQIQAVPVGDCPFDSGVGVRLQELDYLLAHDLGELNLDLLQWPHLNTPQKLLAHLKATLPSESRVFSHGDLCDANVFVDAQDNLHFIDLGRGGIADRWLDIAFVHRNLRNKVSAKTADAFLQSLDEPDNAAKREYFEQLDEFF